MKIINPFGILKNECQKLKKSTKPDLPLKESESTLRIDQSLDLDYELVKI